MASVLDLCALKWKLVSHFGRFEVASGHPAIARPREGGGYELVSGHRRKRACELAGLETMPVIVRDLDRDSAIIVMVDSITREVSYINGEL